MNTTNPLWEPSNKAITKTQLYTFMQQVNQRHKLSLSNYDQLYNWSIKEKESFWKAIWDNFDIKRHSEPTDILSQGENFIDSKWFKGATLNFAENLLSRRDNKTALVFINEQGQRKVLTYKALHQQVAGLASALKNYGVTKGTCIAGVLPNMCETVIAMLATTSIGAVWTSCSPDFGLQSLLDRLGQVQPTLLFTVDSYFYNGKTHDCLDKLTQLSEALPSLKHSIVIPFNRTKLALDKNKNISSWHEFMTDETHLDFEAIPFEAPLYIMYSSGTTGKPKCIVHSIGGTLLQHIKELRLHCDLSEKDNFFYFTTCGWMMWNWMVSALTTGCSITLYDGAPTYPNLSRLFDLIENEKISVFGTSAKYLSAIEKQGLVPKDNYKFSSLRCILSTGSPLSAGSFDYVYNNIKSDLQLSSISGGTDIISCFSLGNPMLPVYRGQLQCRGLGMDVAIYNDQGQSIEGEKGELVCLSPFPSMPVYFWGDDENKAYHKAYFSRFPQCWAQGDFAELTPQQGLIIYGRSDTVLNPGGVRIGTAEIYRQVERIEQVIDSIVIGQSWQDDVRVILFVQLRNDLVLDDNLIKIIKQTIRQHTSPRHVPEKVVQVTEIPRTISGKIVELAVKNAVHGITINNLDALSNPESLEQYKNCPELEN